MDWNDLQAIYDELGTFENVAKAFGCSIHKVQNEMRRRGIKPKQRGRQKGFKHNEAWHAAHREAMKRPEVKQKYRDNLLKRLPTMGGPSANSPLERLLHRALRKLGVSFRTQVRKLDKYVVDIELLQAPIIIEADGAYHFLRKDRDAARDDDLLAAGYKVYRFHGKEINLDPDACIALVVNESGIVRDETPVFDVCNGMVGKDNPGWKGGKVEMTCDYCGSKFTEHAANRKMTKKFCKASCYHAWQREHPESLPSRWRP